jgi:GTP diphosphokinase / guanosine-3',5'-bis(diphosphate) 3'-diphosphatase
MKDMPWTDIDIRLIAAKYRMYKVADAMDLMKGLHKGSFRADGRDYSTHPKKVCQILLYFGVLQVVLLVASLFHDVPEELGEKFLASIKTWFGSDVVRIVDLLTQGKNMTFVKYCSRIATDPRAILIKLADRLHNLRNIIKRIGSSKFFSMERLKEQYIETVEYIVPLAQILIRSDSEYKYTAQSMLDELTVALEEARHILSGVEPIQPRLFL